MTKSKLFREFSFESEQNVRKQIWAVVAKNRNKDINEVKYIKNVRPIEVVALKLFYGVALKESEEKLLDLPRFKKFLEEYR